MHSIERNHRQRGIVLLGIACGYASLNLVAVLLAAHGVIHPLLGILVFFTWFGPAALALGLLSVQFAARRRFGWPAAIAFLLATGFAMLINFNIYGRALAAV